MRRPNDADTRLLEAANRLDAVLQRIAERHHTDLEGAGRTTEDLRRIPPCPICGARARIGANGRLEQPCIRHKHYPKSETAPKPAPVAVQRAFGDDEKEPWWNR